ncbi:MAG: outer membrane lipoprotein LolB [Betaproteobacteria bacterium HGW-Betaproteobacteria-22]|nr:MAG: outer membrane lipoprotein LolB [Betaproteobacteria bacterium HGW-Betaproteobacteria-22]
MALHLHICGLHRPYLLLTLGLTLGLLNACSTSPIQSSETLYSQRLNAAHLKHIGGIQQFSLQGRIGVQSNYKGFSGGLFWQHTPIADEINLHSPLGGQVASIAKNPETITLTDASGKQISASNAETLTYQVLGWSLPLDGLQDWALGRPTENSPSASTWDDNGLLTSLSQNGWQIEYQNYADKDGYQLPHKISLKSEQVNLKLIIEKWSNITP